MRFIVFIGLSLFLPALASAAPFCVVDDRGDERCTYSSMELCRDDARAFGGACIYRPGSAQSESNPYAWGDAVASGLRRGEETRRARELHELEIERQQAQIDAINAQTASIQASNQREAAIRAREAKMEQCKAASEQAVAKSASASASTYAATADACWIELHAMPLQ